AFGGVSGPHFGGGRNANRSAATVITITTTATTFARNRISRNSSCPSRTSDALGGGLRGPVGRLGRSAAGPRTAVCPVGPGATRAARGPLDAARRRSYV